ncbi:sigma-70 family RNA polymerase sigma factor [Cohnella pontilimi]|uniref:Sigma-70 family RNA polymerase sigma factor n=1 Tax=Cohnella pontilimi TaxID=2564100 RepID=A0A4U0FF65_9BACL|nr:sigma-70 family RNA polymerase sigma factor [Cohnella pontilimi]TJY41992.1 sigma-70 family RNA polymerase sigma factor [Cohnella pontilimi]
MDTEEQVLVDALRNHRTMALERLMDQFGNSVYGLVSRILAGTGRVEDTEECVSDVFVTAWRRIDQFDSTRGTLKTWLLVLAKYIALDVRRKLLRQPGTVEIDASESSGENIEEAVLSKEASMEMRNMVNALTEPDRTIFYKRYFYYESVEQIAKALGITNKAVENRLYRIRKEFKEKLQERGTGIKHAK